MATSHSGQTLGLLVYQAPELHEDDGTSLASDVFAFGMLIVETYSGRRPLARALTDLAAIIELYKTKRPSRDEIAREDFTESMWKLAEDCWAHKPSERPAMTSVHARLVDTLPTTSNNAGHN